MFSEKLKNLTDEELASFIDVCDNCNTNVTIVDDVLEGTKYTYLKKLGLCVAGNSQLFSTEESGFLPDIMLDLYNKRVIAKGLMLEYKQKLEDSTTPEDKKKYTDLIAKYHLQQHSMKISLNSAYGAIGNEYFRYYDLRQAEAITISGQLSIKWISQKVNGMLNSTLKTSGVDYTTYIDTDSCKSDTIITTSVGSHTICKLYDMLHGRVETRGIDNYVKHISDDINIASVDCDSKYVVYNKANYIMKHKVKKRMYKITVASKSIEVTEDHSAMVLRNGNIIPVKPADIEGTDEMLLLEQVDILAVTNNFTVEDLGIQEDWVYDIEVNDTHNFFGNGILVHNSIYLQLNEMVKKFTKPDATTNDIINFLDKASKEAIEPFIENCYKELASNMSAYKQAMSMDREVIADKAIFVSKKRYIVSVWDNEGTRYHEQKLKIMGLEVVKSATPPAVKTAMQDCINIIMKQGEPELHNYIDKFKDKFFNLPVNDIALKKNCNRIDTYSDPVSIYRKGTPITQRGGLLYNHYLAKYNIDTKYKPITSGEKLYNVYLTVPNDIMSENVITYPDEIPEEFNLANNIDYDLQYEKVFISPMMGILTCIGWNTEPKNTLDFLF